MEPNKTTVIDPSHPLHGCEVDAHIVYYDHAHTGNSPHLCRITDENGRVHMIYSDKLDMDRFMENERAAARKMIGVSEGDRVRIIKTGGGYFCAGFDMKAIHIVKRIGATAYVTLEEEGYPEKVSSINNPTLALAEIHPDANKVGE